MLQLFLAVLIVNCVLAEDTEDLRKCAESTRISNETLDKLSSFTLPDENVTNEVLDWMVCAVEKYHILGENGCLSESKLKDHYGKNNESYYYLLRTLRGVTCTQDRKKYSFAVYKGLQDYAEKYSDLKCGRRYGVKLKRAKQLKTFNSTWDSITENEKSFIHCFLIRMRVLTNDSKLESYDKLKEHIKADDKLVEALQSLNQSSDNIMYSFEIYKTIEMWKQNKNTGNLTVLAPLILVLLFILPIIL